MEINEHKASDNAIFLYTVTKEHFQVYKYTQSGNPSTKCHEFQRSKKFKELPCDLRNLSLETPNENNLIKLFFEKHFPKTATEEHCRKNCSGDPSSSKNIFFEIETGKTNRGTGPVVKFFKESAQNVRPKSQSAENNFLRRRLETLVLLL